jgi:CRISPR-associated endonuclease Csn1
VNDKFTLQDLQRIKDPERNAAYVQAIRAWLEAGKPKDELPRSPRGDVIRKVRLLTNKNVDVEVRGGAADRGEMARIDVFHKKTPRGAWQYFLVPVYPHQTMKDAPPIEVVPGATPIDGTYDFMWTLHRMTLIELIKPDGEVIEGYFRQLDRSTSAISISPHTTLDDIRRGIGARTLKSFRKFRVDRLGRRFEVGREVRTWRGKACT